MPTNSASPVTTLVWYYPKSGCRSGCGCLFLPAYSPELNPDEQVWNDVKNNAVGRSRPENPEDLHRTVTGRLRFLQKSPERVRSFFQMPETRYAA